MKMKMKQLLIKNSNILQSLGLAIALAVLEVLTSTVQEITWKTLAIAVIGSSVSWYTTRLGKAEKSDKIDS